MERASDLNAWELVLQRVRMEMEPEDFRRWFSSTSYAGDSGDQINVWIGSEAIRRHIEEPGEWLRGAGHANASGEVPVAPAQGQRVSAGCNDSQTQLAPEIGVG